MEDELAEGHAGAVLATSFALVSHGTLHFIGELGQPVLDVAFSHNGVEKLDVFGESSEFHVNFVDVTAFFLIESNGSDTGVKLLEIVLELLGVGSHRENLKEIVSRAEVESGEESTLTTEISIKLLLAMLKLLLEAGQLGNEDIVGTAHNNVGGFVSTLHDLQPGLVDLSEDGGILGQGLSDISFCEHSHEGLPETLDLEPLLNHFRDGREEANLLSDFVLEGSDVSHDSHLVELVNVVFNFSLDVSNISTDGRGDTVDGVDRKLTSIVMGNDIVSELVLKLELLVGIVGDVLNFFLDLKEVGVEKLLEDESLLIEGDLDSSELDDFFPMAVADGVLGKTLNDGE